MFYRFEKDYVSREKGQVAKLDPTLGANLLRKGIVSKLSDEESAELMDKRSIEKAEKVAARKKFIADARKKAKDEDDFAKELAAEEAEKKAKEVKKQEVKKPIVDLDKAPKSEEKKKGFIDKIVDKAKNI